MVPTDSLLCANHLPLFSPSVPSTRFRCLPAPSTSLSSSSFLTELRLILRRGARRVEVYAGKRKEMRVEEVKGVEVEEEEEVPPLVQDEEAIFKPLRIALFVEPSPFA